MSVSSVLTSAESFARNNSTVAFSIGTCCSFSTLRFALPFACAKDVVVINKQKRFTINFLMVNDFHKKPQKMKEETGKLHHRFSLAYEWMKDNDVRN